MSISLIVTGDGSHTVLMPEQNVWYHSLHGAIGESRHVFLEAGYKEAVKRFSGEPELRIFEMGFGTGLNALLTISEAVPGQNIHYVTVETMPLMESDYSQLNYGRQLEQPGLFTSLHEAPWEQTNFIHPNFTLLKQKTSLQDYTRSGSFHLIYYDAFAPSAQPELWTEDIFRQLIGMLVPGGLLVTYCSKSVVRKAMMAAGFTIEKIPGPWGKREMVRASKPA
jgi:tRNA U34 5-methylaminomethyl-2-thiouridine-forming methyltransferase MnmC